MKYHSKGQTISYHEHKFQYLAGRYNFHHNIAEQLGGQKTIQNLIKIDVFRHQAYHYLFSNRSLLESAELLLKAKGICNSRDYGWEAYRLLFGERTFIEAAQFLYRLDKLKRCQTNYCYH